MIYANLPAFPAQTPGSFLDSEFVFAVPLGDQIVSASVASDMGSLMFADTIVVGSSVVTWISGGDVGRVATITCTVVTASGLIWPQSATMEIRAVV